MFPENCWDWSVFFWSIEVGSLVPKLMKQATRPCLLFKDGKSFLKSTQTIVLSTTTGRAITPSSVQILVSFSRWPMCDAVLMKWYLTLSLYLKEHWRGSRRTGKVILIFFCFFFTVSIRSKKAPDNDYRAFQRDTTKKKLMKSCVSIHTQSLAKTPFMSSHERELNSPSSVKIENRSRELGRETTAKNNKCNDLLSR